MYRKCYTNVNKVKWETNVLIIKIFSYDGYGLSHSSFCPVKHTRLATNNQVIEKIVQFAKKCELHCVEVL